ncbi:MFS transporter [Paracraurococcus lichenis]|uniref:MFS transporter n=1 Tax=Paracraurococcus lichenis TaxID=3064888 RepID=A0ABT9E287_9PROT|nr:MFS transporter [Paracraurococcus sp. LOR1-02]MDO9710210.1 MFS transporter [Paracraurococcus sp. LOR1-02]
MSSPSVPGARALDALNFALADVRDGLGPYLAVYLLAQGWDQAATGLVLAVSGIAGLLAQAPAGALVDAVAARRTVIAVAALMVTAACLLIPLFPGFWPVAALQAGSGMAAAVFPPAIAGLTLGLAGRAAFARRTGRNEAWNHAGNAVAAAAAGGLSLWFGPVAVFWLLGGMALASLAAAFAIPAERIDPALARGADDGGQAGGASAWRVLATCRPLLVFALCVALFHLANAAMLPLVGQKLAQQDLKQGTALMSACIVAAQLVMVPMAALAGAKAEAWGRKPLFLAGFAVLALRGWLYTLSDDAWWLVGVQCLDGVGAGLFGALMPMIVADLTKGTGHFGAGLGAVATAQGIGASLSNAAAGWVVVQAGYSAAFLALAATAAAGALLFWQAMPETARDAVTPAAANPASSASPTR